MSDSPHDSLMSPLANNTGPTVAEDVAAGIA
jgi:hypothetical protein